MCILYFEGAKMIYRQIKITYLNANYKYKILPFKVRNYYKEIYIE
jgi:hypothetical protein